MVRAQSARMLLLGAMGLFGVALAFLIGARAGTTLDRVMSFSGSPASVLAR